MSSASLAPHLEVNALQECLYQVLAVHSHPHAARIADVADELVQRTRMPEPQPLTAADCISLNYPVLASLRLPTDASDSVDLPRLREQAVSAFVERIHKNLSDDRNDAAETGDATPSEPAARTCLSLAEMVAPRAALAPALKWAAFTEETGAVSFILQSALTDRRVNFCISADGTNVSFIRIDESMKSEQFDVRLDDANTVRELARWVTRRA